MTTIDDLVGDELWAVIEPLLPPEPPKPKGGRPASQLERAGYEVSYHEFEGGHVVPSVIAREAASWFAGKG